MKIKSENIVIGLFLVVSLGLFTWFNMSKPRILILHSYDKSYAWVRDVNVGLNRVLNSKSRYQVRWYYMDTKRHPWPDYRISAGKAARKVIDQMEPDVIIAVDDDAQKYAADYYLDHPKIKIVFTGVNNDAEDYGYTKARNVTGVLERLPLSALRETLQVAGGLKSLNRPIRIAYLGDRSDTVSGDIKQIKKFDWAPVQLADVVQVDTWAEWQAAVDALQDKADVIILSGYRRLARQAGDKDLVPPAEVVKWTESRSKAPVICTNGFFTEEGGMLAIGTSPYEQGEAGARMALDIVLNGKHPSDMPIISSTQFIVTMSGSKMKTHGFTLPAVYEAAARTGDKYYP